MHGTYQVGRDDAKDLNEQVLTLAGAGVMILARKPATACSPWPDAAIASAGT